MLIKILPLSNKKIYRALCREESELIQPPDV